MALAGTQAEQDCVAQGRAGAILGGSAGSPKWFKESGLGREGSKYGMEEYMEVKYLCMGAE